MKIALAQIDMRLGDIGGICSRISDQLEIAAQQGAQLLCTPTPLFCGCWPGQLVQYPNYEHDLVRSLERLAGDAEREGVACLIPTMTSTDDDDVYDYIFEAFLLRDGRVTPLRRTMSRARQGGNVDPWCPVVFDIADTRVAVTFDLERDISLLPSGCDLLVYFQSVPYDASDIMTQPARALRGGRYDELVTQAGVWLACMAPVGGYDEMAYAGGSFVMDDSGRTLAQAASFQEELLVQEVRRGVQLPKIEGYELASYSREEYFWETLRVHLRDTAAAAGMSRIAVPLTGDLPSSLLAALAVDAVGARNVIGLMCERPDALTPAEEVREDERVGTARDVAERLHLRVIEHAAVDPSRILDRPVGREEMARVRGDAESYYLVDVARAFSALPVSPLTKTEYALCAEQLSAQAPCALAPFGDIYLTELEFLARSRNDSSDALPEALVSPKEVDRKMRKVLAAAGAVFGEDPTYAGRIEELLGSLDATEVDNLLRAHVDRNLELEETQLGRHKPEAAALLLLIVRRGEGARRRLPMATIVSERSFAERSWPVALGWSDTGRRGVVRQDISSLADDALVRYQASGEEYGSRVKDELFDLLGNMTGLTPEQLDAMQSDEGQQRMRELLESVGDQLRDAFEQLAEENEDFRKLLEQIQEHVNIDFSQGPPQHGGTGEGDDGGEDSQFFSEN